MTKMYLLAIPVAIGAVAGMILAYYLESGSDPPTLTTSGLRDGGSPVLGDHSAQITILEWGDYQCTYCYRFHQNTLDAIDEGYIRTGIVNMVFKDFPLNGPDSRFAAEASYCADDQKKYWEYHDKLYENWGGERTGWITRDSLNAFAAAIGLDMEVFSKCLDEQKYMDKVNATYEFGREMGIDATPSFLVFDDEQIIKIVGNQPLEIFLKTFERLSNQN